jgi:hypothetical protein
LRLWSSPGNPDQRPSGSIEQRNDEHRSKPDLEEEPGDDRSSSVG